MRATDLKIYSDKRLPKDRLGTGLILIVFFVLFLGGGILQIFNWQTGLPSAPMYQRFFPHFYITLIVLLFIDKSHLKRSKEEIALVVCFVVLVFYMTLVGNTSGFGNLLNCLILPIFISFILNGSNSVTLKRVRSLLFTFFVINCILAITERILQFNIFPLLGTEGDEEVVDNVFRSTAIQNHPLNNALFTSIIMSFILVDKQLSPLKKYGLLFLGYSGFLCYNTRSSIVLWGVILALHFIFVLFSGDKKFRKIKPWLIIAFVVVVISFYLLLFVYGWGNRLVQLDFSDDPSTYQRLKLIRLISSLNISDFLIGISATDADKLFLRFDLEHVENYWILYIIRYGIIFTVILIVLYARLFKRLFNGYLRRSLYFISVVFLLLSSTNNSLAYNSQALSLMIICCYGFSPILVKVKK